MIERSLFVPAGASRRAAFPLAVNRTVPTEAMALLLAGLTGEAGRVLEIGTGSGYQAAVLAERCDEVVSIEINPLESTAERLPAKVTLITADGLGYDTGEEFDAVLVTFGVERIAPVWVMQLREGGRLVVPLKLGSCARICVYEKREDRLVLMEVAAYAAFTEALQEAA